MAHRDHMRDYRARRRIEDKEHGEAIELFETKMSEAGKVLADALLTRYRKKSDE
jgi:hypothetical protein